MNLDKFFNVLTAIVGVALATTIVTSRQTASIIRAFGSAFSGSLLAAQGRTGGRR